MSDIPSRPLVGDCPSLVEDRMAISNLVLSYGFLVDQCDADRVADLWLEDGEYEVIGIGIWKGRDQLKAMVSSDLHQYYVAAGCAHFMGAPEIVVNGDQASVRNYSMLVVASGDGFNVERMSRNVWFLTRTNAGWKVRRRENVLVSPQQTQNTGSYET